MVIIKVQRVAAMGLQSVTYGIKVKIIIHLGIKIKIHKILFHFLKTLKSRFWKTFYNFIDT